MTRDAAVSPVSGDFLPPVSGISPGIHGNQGVRPVLSGAVSSTANTQETAETNDVLRWQSDGFVSALVVAPSTKSLSAGASATQQLSATATMSDAATTQVVTGDVAWESSDEAKATVSAGGLVTAKATGSATITGTYKGQTDTCVVTVGA